MEPKRDNANSCPDVVWFMIDRITKNGNEAIVKRVNGEIHIIEVERKIKMKVK